MNNHLIHAAGSIALTLSISGCAALETTGEVVGGIAQAVGETTLFVADVATFGAISSLTGFKDAGWAASPETSASLYSTAASTYVSAKSTTNSGYSAASDPSSYSTKASSSSYSSSQSVSGGGASPKQRYSGSDLSHCVSLVNDSNTIASFIQNSCSEKVTVSYIPASGMGAGSRGTQFVAGGSRQSTNKTSGISGVVVCRYGDLMDYQTRMCTASGGQ
jgi:hypothetical protein